MAEIHWKTVNEIVEEKKQDLSVLAINVFGSLARGGEGPDSDIDLEIISLTEPEWKMAEEERNGLVVDFVYTPKEFILNKVKNYPYLSYVHITEKIVYDSEGFMADIQKQLNNYFSEHPKVLEFWDKKIALMRDEKAKGIKNPEGGIKAYDEAEILFSESHTITRNFWRS